ncbi:multidrug transporter MatE [Defluviimonas sp. 20V17]|uniref:Multidrug-efflux transporter n=1 Tax=Allgaiera indica TaxID=765699 RepID=A0AAN4USY9_9RHOB|nr:MATE family efflux transporter [Allgaiera indica]KDB02238.1 multidrug transporter MatE [Defluviimonas sp. 20V17]GHE02675.1 MATE family efflux transporter [Allgaiera indica]SDX19392.1 multidrug resistance protein, MATE family [Allgaiera indica]
MVQEGTFRAQIRATLGLGLPLIGANLATLALGITDTVMLGWYSVPALAASTLGFSFYFLLFILGKGFSAAVMPMVAQAASGGDETEARRVTRMGLWLSLAFAALAIPVTWFSGPILIAMGQQPKLAALTQDYLRIFGFTMLPALMLQVLISFLAAMERAQRVLWASLIGAVLNAGLDYALIFGNFGLPALGLRGAAIASVFTQTLIFLIAAGFATLPYEMRRYQLFVRFWRPDWAALAQVFRLGLPIGLTSLAEGGLFSASALMMGWIGTLALAAHGITLQIVSLTFMVHMGLSSAATVRAGRAQGRRDARDLRLGALAAVTLSGVFGLLSVAVIVLMPRQLLGLFIDPTDPLKPQLLGVGTRLLMVAALFQMTDAAQVMALGLLRGLRDTRVPMIQAAISYWLIGIPAGYVLAFPMGFGAVGVWFGLVIGLTVAGVLMMTRFWRLAPHPGTSQPA